jgi:hypothetical protein
MSRYAEGTTVDVERSIGEIKRTLQRFGATSFAYREDTTELQIAFMVRGLNILMRVALPSIDDFALTESTNRKRSENTQRQAWEQECRRRVRSLAAVIKAKLVAVIDEVATLETEFLPYILVDGMQTTIGEVIVPRLPQIVSGQLALPGGSE